MSENCNDCPVLPRVEALEEANRQHGATHRKIFDKLEALKVENATQNANWEHVDGKLDELTAMVRDLTGKAGRRWDKAIETILVAVVTGVVCFLLGRVGL